MQQARVGHGKRGVQEPRLPPFILRFLAQPRAMPDVTVLPQHSCFLVHVKVLVQCLVPWQASVAALQAIQEQRAALVSKAGRPRPLALRANSAPILVSLQ